MNAIRIEIPDGLLASMKIPPETVANEIRLSAALRWYAAGRIDLTRAAELAGLSEPKLLAASVQDRLGAACKRGDEMSYARALEEMQPQSRRPERDAAFEWVRTFRDPEARAYGLSFLAQGLETQERIQVLRDARETALIIGSEPARTRLMDRLAPLLANAGDYQGALAATEAISDERSRLACLVSIAPSLPPAHRAKALNIAELIDDQDERERARGRLALLFGTPPSSTAPAGNVAQEKDGTRFSTTEAESHYQALGRWRGSASSREAQESSREFWRRFADRGVPWLVRRLRGERRVDRLHGAASLLADLGVRCIKPIFKELRRGPTVDQALALLQALSWIAESLNLNLKTIGAEVALADFLQHDEPDVREAAARAMRLLAPGRSSHWLANRLRDEQNADVRATLEEELADLPQRSGMSQC